MWRSHATTMDGHSSNSNDASRVLSDGQQFCEVEKIRITIDHNALSCVSKVHMV